MLVTFTYSNKNKLHLSCEHLNCKNRELAMSYRWPALTFIASICAGMFCGTLGVAGDLMAAPTNLDAATAQAPPAVLGKQTPLDTGNGKHALKARAPKPGSRKISTYSLPNASARHDDAVRSNNVRSVKPSNSVVTGSLPPLLAKNGFHDESIARLRVEPAGDDGVTLDCRKGAFSQIRRTLTACYMQQLDKSWRAQTYVSKGSADGSPGWGGGVALGYAY